MVTYSNTVTWIIPWIEEMTATIHGMAKVAHDRVTEQAAEPKEPLLKGRPCWESSVTRGAALHYCLVTQLSPTLL